MLPDTAPVTAHLLLPCASTALGRLEDSSSKVVKAALQLVFAMITYSPFGARLAPAAFAATLAQQEALLEEMAPAGADGEAAEGEVWKSGTVQVGEAAAAVGTASAHGQHSKVPGGGEEWGDEEHAAWLMNHPSGCGKLVTAQSCKLRARLHMWATCHTHMFGGPAQQTPA